MPGYHSRRVLGLLVAGCLAPAVVNGQSPYNETPSSAPFAYPGMPTTPYGPDWQAYYEVKSNLTNITFELPHAYAGSVSVNRDNHPNNTLFFLAFEKEGQNGSLAANDGERSNEPWIIWLNGGPGSSSMIGAFEENGPAIVEATPNGSNYNISYKQNSYSWHKQADIFYIDQPVGTGYSTTDADGYIPDEDQMGRDFAGFLQNVVAVFPSLKKRPLYITGESYSGVYIPYIAKTIFGMPNPPVNLAKIAIGDGVLTQEVSSDNFPVLAIIQTYPQLIDFNTSIYEYFLEQYNLCGFNLTLQYPSPAPYPPIYAPTNSYFGRRNRRSRKSRSQALKLALNFHASSSDAQSSRRKRATTADNANRTFALTGHIDSYYECSLQEELIDYAFNFTVPWQGDEDFDVYDIPDAVNPSPPASPELLLNDPAVRQALHAPEKNWTESINYPYSFNTTTCNCLPNESGDPSPESMQFLSELSKNVSMVIYEGNDDLIVAHREAELAIQNMTFGGVRGFTSRPSTPWSDTDGNLAGIIHQERNVTYALVIGAGHLVPGDKPKSAYALLEQFILGNNQTGAVITNSGSTTVVGGVHSEYFNEIITATNGINTGSGEIQGTYTWAHSYWDNWNSYMATRTAANLPATATATVTATSSGRKTRKMDGFGVKAAISAMILVAVQLCSG